ncbi:flagellar motor protein MotB [Aliikangiella sp. G2MR2-5]|uniref:flagellar motor protein MotB n=1 Tax=Aliikangiella sp. G2MR2-5 TaxID=2788943 RepID=UPI0018AAEF66|nr:flagellar motor protein MotB [Aliikangiella sp. G2MR2-5]
MADNSENAKPIIIKRVKKNLHDFHGGSWKVAFADFATAMMAFFLLLWLIGNTSDEQQQAISGYFSDPVGYADKSAASKSVIGEGGQNASVIEYKNVKPETDIKDILEDDLDKLAEEKEIAKLELLKEKLESLVDNSKAFEQFKKQVMLDITPAGLRIQIVDEDKRPMFDSGSAEPKYYSKLILRGLASVLKKVPNKLSVTGHTDATPYIEREDYGNWELSADRANAARRELVVGGINEDKIARVEGFSSSILFDKDNPHNPVNRRIAIIVLKPSVARDIEKQVLGVD